MAKPVVDQNECIGCGLCADLCPEVFQLVDEKSIVIGPDKCDTCDIEEAVDACPVEAITLED